MDEIVKSTKQLLACCSTNCDIEIEARIRRQLASGECTIRLIKADMQWTKAMYTERRRISKSNRKCTYRQRIGLQPSVADQESQVVCKSSITKADMNDLWCTVHVSTEVPVPYMSHTLEHVPAVHVTRYRGTLDGHYVDITISADPKDRDTALANPFQRFAAAAKGRRQLLMRTVYLLLRM